MNTHSNTNPAWSKPTVDDAPQVPDAAYEAAAQNATPVNQPPQPPAQASAYAPPQPPAQAAPYVPPQPPQPPAQAAAYAPPQPPQPPAQAAMQTAYIQLSQRAMQTAKQDSRLTEESYSEILQRPTLSIITSQSPQVTVGDAAYIPNAQIGDVCMPKTGQIIAKANEPQSAAKVLPCYYTPQYSLVFHPPDQKSATYINIVGTSRNCIAGLQKIGNDWVQPNAREHEYVRESHVFYCLAAIDQVWTPCAIYMKTGRAEAARSWVNLMQRQKCQLKDGCIITAPSYSVIYALRSKQTTSKRNGYTYLTWDINLFAPLYDWDKDDEIYAMAQALANEAHAQKEAD